jgi:hypothetical protein
MAYAPFLTNSATRVDTPFCAASQTTFDDGGEVVDHHCSTDALPLSEDLLNQPCDATPRLKRCGAFKASDLPLL